MATQTNRSSSLARYASGCYSRGRLQHLQGSASVDAEWLAEIDREILEIPDMLTGDAFLEPFALPPERRRSSRMLQRSPGFREDSGHHTGMRLSMRMLLSFGVRRHMVHAAPEPSYEAMLALDENNPRRGVKKHILEGLPHHTARKQETLKECQICLENFRKGCKILVLPCEHAFCSSCIRKWLFNHRTCPVCRFEFPDQHTILVK